jgi:hypothetical protein
MLRILVHREHLGVERHIVSGGSGKTHQGRDHCELLGLGHE